MIKLERFKWTNYAPDIYITLYYESKRIDKDMYYRIQYVVEPVKGLSYFGYTIKTSVDIDDVNVLGEKTLKNASPSQWSNNITYTTSWLKVANKTSGDAKIEIRVYSGGGDERDVTKTYGSVPIVDYASSVGYMKVNGTYREVKPYVKVNGTWRETTKTFVKVNGTWRETK